MSTLTRSCAALLGLALFTNSVRAAPAAEVIELDEAEVYIEFNATDDEYVLLVQFEADAWRTMSVKGPSSKNGKLKPVLNVKAGGDIKAQGLTEGLFETEALDLEEETVEDFLARFPEGEYAFKGRGLEKGEVYEGDAEFTHDIPDDPGNVFPDDGDVLDAAAGITVTFDPVTEDLDGDPITVVHYTVLVEYESESSGEDVVFTMQIEGDAGAPAVTIPPEFLLDETEYTVEIIVQEESGNRTVCELDFETL